MRSNLKSLLAERGMSQMDLARKLGVHGQSVYRWTKDEGVGMLTLRRAEEIAGALGCDAKDLFDEGEDCEGDSGAG